MHFNYIQLFIREWRKIEGDCEGTNMCLSMEDLHQIQRRESSATDDGESQKHSTHTIHWIAIEPKHIPQRHITRSYCWLYGDGGEIAEEEIVPG